MAGFNLSIGREGEGIDEAQQEEEDIAGQDIVLLLELPDGTVLEETFKAGVNVEWVVNVVSGKTPFKFDQIGLYLDTLKLLGPMSLCDYP
jgi:hypothetical protein